MIGFFERVYGLNAEGWATNTQLTEDNFKLFVVDSTGKIVGTGQTQLQRPDVYKATGSGLGSGFSIRIKEKCNPGRIRVLNEDGDELPSNDFILAPRFFPDYKLESYIGNRNHNLFNFSVFIFAPIDWEIRFQRPQHLAVYLSQLGYRVFYVQPRLGFSTCEVDIVTDLVSSNIYLIRICVNKPAATILDLDMDFQAFISKKLNTELLQFSKSVNIIQHPLWYGIIKYKSVKTTSIFDFLDDVAGVKGEHGLRALKYQVKLIMQSDFVVATSETLRQVALLSRREVFIAPNGASKIFLAVRPSIRTSNNTALYIGAVEEWFDFELINNMMEADRCIKLIVVGSCSDHFKSLFLYADRIEFLGEVDHFALPQIMSRARVGIIPFKNNRFSKTIDAVKKYEYIMAGLPVVASGLVEDYDLKNYFRVENDSLMFVKAVREAMKRGYVSRIKGKMLAQRKTWNHQLDTYRKILLTL